MSPISSALSAPSRRYFPPRTRAWLTGLLLGLFSLTLQAEEYWIYTVRPGDNIWNLSKRYCTSVLYWQRLQRLNNVRKDREIPPGTKLRFPIAWLKHQPASATVVQVTGSAALLRAGETVASTLTSGTELKSGDSITTAGDSNLTVRFADGSELLVQSGSEVVMDSLSAWGKTGMVDTRLRLKNGRVDTRVRPSQGPGSRYEITTPAAVAAVRGTDFRVSAERDQPVARSEVLEGKVGVSGTGKEQLVPAGFGIVAEAGKPPEPPKPLLPPVDTRSLPKEFEHLPMTFQWPAPESAISYRYQISSDPNFKKLLADKTTQKPTGSWASLPDGDYVLRIRAVDDSGLEGLNADHAFTVDARPEPPVLLELIDGVTVRDRRPVFRWSEPEDATGFHLQLARDQGFEELVLDLDNQQGRELQPGEELSVGHYYWRLATRLADGETGPFSDAQHFEVRVAPDSPGLKSSDIDRHHLNLSWLPSAEQVTYQFQLARDPAFEDVITTRMTSETRVQLDKPEAGTYYFRIRALDRDGFAGAFGATHTIDVPAPGYWPLLLLLAPLLLL